MKNQNPQPEVSIIMATYNSSKYLKETLDSILAQSFTDWELLITDDRSVDKTLELLVQYQESDIRIYFWKNPKNSGAAVSRNNSISHAKGRYIAFLDSDDIWRSQKLKCHLQFMKQNNAALSFTSYELINEYSDKQGKIVDKQDLGWVNYDELLRKKATFGCSTVVVDKELIGDFSMPLLRTGQDYATWLSLIKISGKALHFPKVLTSYRITPGSISRNKFKKAQRQWQIYRDVEKLSLLKSVYCFCCYAYQAVFRK